MYQLRTEKQHKYFAEVIRLHFQEGYGEDRISRILTIGHTTASRWIGIFAKEKGMISRACDMEKTRKPGNEPKPSEDVETLKNRVRELEAKLLRAEMKADFYDEMINVAEARFKIPIRKKAGAKQ